MSNIGGYKPHEDVSMTQVANASLWNEIKGLTEDEFRTRANSVMAKSNIKQEQDSAVLDAFKIKIMGTPSEKEQAQIDLDKLESQMDSHKFTQALYFSESIVKDMQANNLTLADMQAPEKPNNIIYSGKIDHHTEDLKNDNKQSILKLISKYKLDLDDETISWSNQDFLDSLSLNKLIELKKSLYTKARAIEENTHAA